MSKVIALHNYDNNPSELRPEGYPDTTTDVCQAMETIASIGETAICKIYELRDYANYADKAVPLAAETTAATIADVAETTLATIAAMARLPSFDQWPPPRHRLWVVVQAIEKHLSGWRRRWLRSAPQHVQRAWTIAGLALTLLVALAVVQHQWWLAVGLLVSRVTGSLLFGNEANLPFEGGVAGDTGFGVVTKCMASHLSDVSILLSVSWVLLTANRTLWAAAVSLTAIAMLMATLYRVAVLQVGVRLYRWQLERVFRVGGMLVGLALSASAPTALPTAGLPLLAVSAVGPLLYAAVESIRATWRLRWEDKHRGGRPRVKILVSRYRDKVLSSDPLPSRPGDLRPRSKAASCTR